MWYLSMEAYTGNLLKNIQFYTHTYTYLFAQMLPYHASDYALMIITNISQMHFILISFKLSFPYDKITFSYLY